MRPQNEWFLICLVSNCVNILTFEFGIGKCFVLSVVKVWNSVCFFYHLIASRDLQDIKHLGLK